jgi:hypothetical protein
MVLHLATICGALTILVAIASAASIELSTLRSETSQARDAKTSVSSHMRLQNTEESAIIAMVAAFPRLQSLSSMFYAIRILCVAV